MKITRGRENKEMRKLYGSILGNINLINYISKSLNIPLNILFY